MRGQTKTARIGVRVTPRSRRLLEAAAEREGVTLSRFVARASRREAVAALAGRDEPALADDRDET